MFLVIEGSVNRYTIQVCSSSVYTALYTPFSSSKTDAPFPEPPTSINQSPWWMSILPDSPTDARLQSLFYLHSRVPSKRKKSTACLPSEGK
jgi:hypothetical protein